MVQALTGSLVTGLSGIEAARFCNRETWSVLKRKMVDLPAVKLIEELKAFYNDFIRRGRTGDDLLNDIDDGA